MRVRHSDGRPSHSGEKRGQRPTEEAVRCAGKAGKRAETEKKWNVLGPDEATNTLVAALVAVGREHYQDDVDLETAVLSAWALVAGKKFWDGPMVTAVREVMAR